MLNIIYCCDNDYLDLTSISMSSVIENNKDEEITFYLATEHNKHKKLDTLINHFSKHTNVKIIHLDCTKYDNLFDELKLNKWGSQSYYTYWKLVAFDLIDCEYAWYIDSDILCLNKINNPHLEKTVGGVLDCAHPAYHEAMGFNKDFKFFNAAAFYANIKKWKENKCTDRIINYLKENRPKLFMADQDLFSLVLQDETEVISPMYDYLVCFDYYGIHKTFCIYLLNKKFFYKEEEIEEAKKNIIFYHCLKGVFGRPWEKGNNSPIKTEFNYYRNLSPFKDFETKRTMTILDKLEKCAEILPDFLYVRIHSIAQTIFAKIAKKQVNR